MISPKSFPGAREPTEPGAGQTRSRTHQKVNPAMANIYTNIRSLANIGRCLHVVGTQVPC